MKTSKSHSEIIWPLATWNFKIVATLRDIQHNNHCFYNLDSFPLEHSCDWVGYSMINWVKGKSIRVHNLSWHYDFGHGCLCKRCYSAMLWFGKKFGWFLQIISPLKKAWKFIELSTSGLIGKKLVAENYRAHNSFHFNKKQYFIN